MDCVYVREANESEESFKERAYEEHRIKTNTSKDHVLLFMGSHKKQDDWLINNEKDEE